MPKKKRRTEKDKKAKKKPWLNEREILSYEQQILDNNRQLARLRSRNNELEDEVKNLKLQLQELEEDRSDIVAHLKRNLEEKIQETRELNERLVALSELQKEELESFKKKEETMELEYRTMENNLSAEVKLAAGKLNALEDWRLARTDLMHKFEIQEQRMAEQESRHKQKLHEAEKTTILGKAKLQQDLEKRLNELAENFEKATNIRIADATHQTVKENIALNQELEVMLRICREMKSKVDNYKAANQILRVRADVSESEANITLNEITKQSDAILKFAREYNDMNIAYGKILRNNYYNKNHKDILEKCKMRCITAEKKIRILERQLEEVKNTKENMTAEIRLKRQSFDNINNVLQDAKKCIMNALKLQNETIAEDECISCNTELKDKLLLSLINILQKHTDQYVFQEDTDIRVLETECIYKRGSLGLLQNAELPNLEQKATVEMNKNIIEQKLMDDVEGRVENKMSDRRIKQNVQTWLSSDISSDIPSPIETVSTVSTSN